MWKPDVNRLPPFLRNVAVVLSGAVAAQLVTLLFTPLLTRLYPVEAFALTQSFAAAATALLAAACLRYDAAMTAATDEDIDPLIVICLITGLVTSIAIAATLSFMGPALLEKLGLAGLDHLNVLFAVGMIVSVAANALTFLLIRLRRYGDMSRARMIQPLVFITAALAFHFLSFGMIGLIAADICGRLALAVSFLFFYRRAAEPIDFSRAWPQLRRVIGRYRLFPLVSMPGSILSTIGSAFNTIWMLTLFNAQTAGAYALVERVATLPAGFVANAVAQVYQGELSHALQSRAADLRTGFRRVLAAQIKVSIIPTLIGMALAPWLFPLVFGAEWALAGQLCQTVLPLIFVTFVAAPFNMALTLMERQRAQIQWEAGRFPLILGAWAFAYHAQWDPIPTLRLVTTVSALSYLAYLAICYHEIGVRERQHADTPSAS